MTITSRRTLLKTASALAPIKALGISLGISGVDSGASATTDAFPTQPPELAREMVTVAHFDLKRVQHLVTRRPSLARASWDWGFGDWEDALGAASHMGNRPIAEFLLLNGARPTLFSAAMLGQLGVVKAFVVAQPGCQRTIGPHSIPLLAHARSGGPASVPVYDFLMSLGDAGAEAALPITPEEGIQYLGSYRFGVATSQTIEVTLEDNHFLKTKQLTWTRTGTMGRPLYRVSDGVFFPAGTPAVRIRFTSEGNEMVMRVEDPDLVMTALRK